MSTYKNPLQQQEKLINPTRDQILDQLSKRKDLLQICNDIAIGYRQANKASNVKKEVMGAPSIKSPYTDDLYQELFLALCKKDDADIVTMYEEGWLDFFCIRTLTNMFNSTTSAFYKTFKRAEEFEIDHMVEGEDILDELPGEHILNEDEDTLTNLRLEMFGLARKSLGMYDRGILDSYMQHGTVISTSRALGINTRYISETMKKVRSLLKLKINELMDTATSQSAFTADAVILTNQFYLKNPNNEL